MTYNNNIFFTVFETRISALRNCERNRATLFANQQFFSLQTRERRPDRTSAVKKRVDVRQWNATCSKLFRDNAN